MTETSDSGFMCTKGRRITALVKQSPSMVLTSLNQYLDLALLREAFYRTRKDGAPGVDGQTWDDYAVDLVKNLRSLLERAKSGTYRAPPVRRVHIPKGTSGETRPIGIPTLEDKVLQRAVAMILTAIYEQDFRDFSYGFRPGRSAHQALDSLWRQTMQIAGGWILDLDIRQFFDMLDHGHLREFLKRRVRDGVLLRLVNKWLKAGVMEDGVVSHPTAGSPQGGVISPLLANIYLHYVLDEWFVNDVLPRMRGKAFLIRYADDAVLGFTQESDARRVLDVLPKRLGKYGLTLHPEKTKLIRFQRPKSGSRPEGGPDGGRPGTFDFLGFRHFWGQSQKGSWVVRRKTAPSRFTRAVRAISQWCRMNRHRPLAEQLAQLTAKLRGHCAYYGIIGNSAALNRYRDEMQRAWYKWLSRRHRKRPAWTWYARLRERYRLPPARLPPRALRRA